MPSSEENYGGRDGTGSYGVGLMEDPDETAAGQLGNPAMHRARMHSPPPKLGRSRFFHPVLRAISVRFPDKHLKILDCPKIEAWLCALAPVIGRQTSKSPNIQARVLHSHLRKAIANELISPKSGRRRGQKDLGLGRGGMGAEICRRPSPDVVPPGNGVLGKWANHERVRLRPVCCSSKIF